MKNDPIYGKGHSYEMLLRYAFKLNERKFSKGADSSIYENLFYIEKGMNYVKGNTYEKQFKQIIRYLEKGFECLLKEEAFTLEDKNELLILKLKLEVTLTEPQLNSIITSGMDIIIPYKEVLLK